MKLQNLGEWWFPVVTSHSCRLQNWFVPRFIWIWQSENQRRVHHIRFGQRNIIDGFWVAGRTGEERPGGMNKLFCLNCHFLSSIRDFVAHFPIFLFFWLVFIELSGGCEALEMYSWRYVLWPDMEKYFLGFFCWKLWNIFCFYYDEWHRVLNIKMSRKFSNKMVEWDVDVDWDWTAGYIGCSRQLTIQ